LYSWNHITSLKKKERKDFNSYVRNKEDTVSASSKLQAYNMSDYSESLIKNSIYSERYSKFFAGYFS
jgi:ribosomal protein L21E